MSSAFGDFGPLTERRKAEKARQQKRRIMIAVGTVSIIAVLIVIGAAAVAYSGKSSSGEGGHKSSNKGGSPSPSKSKSGAGHSSPSSDSSDSSSPSSDSSSSSSPSGDSKKPAAGGDLKSVSKSIKMMCSQTDYTDACEKSLGKAAAAANASASSSPKDIVRAAVEVIGDAIGEAFGRADLILSSDPRVKAAVADCKEIFGDAKDDLNRTVHGVDAKDGGLGKEDASYQLRIWLSAVIAHMETCIDGFPDDEFKAKVKDSFTSGKELTSNALALIEKGTSLLSVLKGSSSSKRRLLGSDEPPAMDGDGVPEWVPEAERRVLKGGGFKNTLTPNVVVAKDGSGKFKTIGEALSAMPKNSKDRYVIQVKEGVYEEYVTVTRAMANVTLLGEGSKKSIVTGKKSFADGVTTFKTATFTAQGDGFMAIGMGFQNTAGPEKHQAVALLVQSDKSIFLNCRMDAFQDTLYAHSKAQFYRNCVISGTVDFIFGDAAAVFQNCILVLRRPMDNQQNIATAQGRADAREATGFVLQKCEFQAETALRDAARPPIRNYLGRPWRECSRTLVMESEIPDFIDKAGYMPWQGDFGLKTLWYAEYGNTGPGANTAGRVAWPGYKKVISKADAAKFTVENFLHAQPWIDPTGTPVKYDLFT